jgi:acetyl esterase/lipase
VPDLEEIREKRVVYSLPGMESNTPARDVAYKQVGELTLHADVYRPSASGSVPLVICIAGSGPFSILKNIKDHGVYQSYGQILAASGMGAITFNHRSPGEHGLQAVAQDVDDLVAWARAHASEYDCDADRLALWAFSGGPPFGFRSAMRDVPPFVRCLVSYYGIMDYRHVQEDMEFRLDEAPEEFSPAAYIVKAAGRLPPVFIAKAGQDRAKLNESIDRFVSEALAHDLSLDLMTHPIGHHAFDIIDDHPRSREIIRHTLSFLAEHLGA